jgi:RimJ/RimL family protein N-acetyltransferase
MAGMGEHGIDDGVVRLREWADDDAAWYAASVRDPVIQRFTTESPALEAAQVLAAIGRLRASGTDAGVVICDAVTGARLGNIALSHDGRSGDVSYWVAAEGRGRGVATRALALFSAWSLGAAGLDELWLVVHQDNIASQRVAIRAGYRRDPARDETQQVKGAIWPMLGFTLTAANFEQAAAGGLSCDSAHLPETKS